jgi:mRNA interferase HigB
MMRIISISTLREYWIKHRETEEQLKDWNAFVKKAKWERPSDVKKQFKSASILGDNRVVFNICGGNYRLVVKINYDAEIVYIRFIDTHSKYDKINAEEV